MNGRSTVPRWLRETSNPSSALRTCVMGGVLPTTSFGHDGGLGRLARHFVVILQRHDQHGVRVFPELHEVGHAADDAAVGGFAERRLVDRAVGRDELVIGPVQIAARVASRFASGQPSFCDCRTRRARSRRPTRAARRLPTSVPSAFSVVPP